MTAPSTRAHTAPANGLTFPAHAASPVAVADLSGTDEGGGGDVFRLTPLELLGGALLALVVLLGAALVLVVGAIVVEGMVGR